MAYSETATDAMIRIWKLARLAHGGGGLGYPSINILHPEFGVGCGTGDLPSQGVTDADRVQKIVDRMPREMRSAFEAYHLGVVRGDSCRDRSHKFRWLILGISERTYFRRVKSGREFIRQWLDEWQ